MADPQSPEPRLVHEPRFDIHKWNVLGLGVVAGVAVFLTGFAVFHSVLVALVLGILGGWGVSRVPDLVGGAWGSAFFASGRTTPHPAEHSQARGLALQGHVAAALHAYEEAIVEDPGDPEPYVESARLYRDALARPAEALAWYRRARSARRLTPGQDALIIRELTEVCVHRLGEPLRAAPELSHLARTRPGSPEGEWARRELERIRAEALAGERASPPAAGTPPE